MPIDLTRPLAWTRAEPGQRQLLQDLQANILKGHGRPHATLLLLRFEQAAAGRLCLARLARQVTPALRQLRAAQAYRRSGRSGGRVTLLWLSHAGYLALGAAAACIPADAAFRAGMAARRARLGDPPAALWEPHWREGAHALVLLADDSAAALRGAQQALRAELPAGVRVVGEECAHAMASRLSPGEAIDHFGFVHGRSQPLMLEEDILRERDHRDGTSVWDPAFGPDLALVPDPAGRGATSYGSYLVLRKLEQDARGFHQAQARLARQLGLRGSDTRRAGALLVGRFEDGTPLVLQHAPGANAPVPNNFDYLDDPHGGKCPLHSHIRKTNPRGEAGALGMAITQERAHLMPRRGMPYGQAPLHPNTPGLKPSQRPSGGVGLLFMAYQRDIANQFEFTQAQWANNPAAVRARPRTGIDPLIGQGPAGGQRCPLHWGGDATAPRQAVDMRGFVTLKGGDYFFAPSISGLKALATLPRQR